MSSNTGDNRRTTTVKNHNGLPPQEPEHLPCPRCDSTNTKFCYYNNYNFSQPRHFCKACRRYWTQGGTLRDIPVGGGSRKRPRVSTRNEVSSGFEYHAILPTTTTTPPVLMSNNNYTSLLSSGFYQDVSFGLGRTVWPFSGLGGGVAAGTAAAVGGDGSTWQLKSGAGGGDCCVLPDLAISTPENVMKNVTKIE